MTQAENQKGVRPLLALTRFDAGQPGADFDFLELSGRQSDQF